MSVNSDPIHLHYLTKRFSLTDRQRLKRFLISLLKKEGFKTANINIVFCSDDYLLAINKQYLKHDYYTDIVTFNLTEASHLPLQADIFISIDRIKDNAQNLNVYFKRELHRVIFHGLLHLCGYTDKTNTDKNNMRAREDFYLNKYFN